MLRIEKQEQTSGKCRDRRDKTNCPDLNIPEYHIFNEKNHLIAIAYVDPAELHLTNREEAKDYFSAHRTLDLMGVPRKDEISTLSLQGRLEYLQAQIGLDSGKDTNRTTSSSTQYKSSGDSRAKKKAVRKSRSK